MSIDKYGPSNGIQFVLGNEAIARGALESGVQFAAGYPGTPSSEILQQLIDAAGNLNLHAEWSINEKVSTEKAAAAAIAGLRSMAIMKNAGLSVALDFITHLSYSGLGTGGGAMVIAVCDDPDAHSSGDETDSRWLAKFGTLPLLEPRTPQEALEMVKYGFALSEELHHVVMLRGYTRLSHSSGSVQFSSLPAFNRKAYSDPRDFINPYLGRPKHIEALRRLGVFQLRFEASPYNVYEGPDHPELLIVCGGSGYPCSRDALELLELDRRVGILAIGTIWPFPKRTLAKHLLKSDRILVVEEVDPFIEAQVKEAIVDTGLQGKAVLGKESGHIPLFGEITPEATISALTKIFGIAHRPKNARYQDVSLKSADELLIGRGLTWCAGCPHRASYWALEKAIKADGRDGYVTGDIGCYCLDIQPSAKHQENLMQAMGSGAGLAAGLGLMGQFGHAQPIVSLCGDSTFFHASIPALVDAVHSRSKMVLIVMDNDVTAMTGLQPHPGTPSDGPESNRNRIDIEKFCKSLGCEVAVSDPFTLRDTIQKIREFMEAETGVRVLILRRPCELSRMRREKRKPYAVHIDPDKCKGEECAVCFSKFRCPAFDRDPENGKAMIRSDICSGCGVCAQICPFKAISKGEKSS